jgi:hypothetical protein
MDYSSFVNKFDDILVENKRNFLFMYRFKKRGGYGDQKKEHFFYFSQTIQ